MKRVSIKSIIKIICILIICYLVYIYYVQDKKIILENKNLDKVSIENDTLKKQNVLIKKITIPEEFRKDDVKEIEVIAQYSYNSNFTSKQKEDREIFWNNFLLEIKNNMSCSSSDCVSAHIKGPCGGSDLMIKKEYLDIGVDFYNQIWSAYFSEFPVVYDC